MSCTTCPQAQPLPNCTQYLNLGTIADPLSDVLVYFKRLAGTRTEQIEATSDSNGAVFVDLTPIADFLASKSQFEVWVTLPAASMNDRLTITIDAAEQDCLLLTFEKVAGVSYMTQEVKL